MQIGVYSDNHLIKNYQTTEQTSEVLPILFATILEDYSPARLFFARGPGSFMAIKISYIFLKTLSLSLNIPLFACDGFVLNNNKPIKAMRNLYFVKENHEIVTRHFDDNIEQNFQLPTELNPSQFSDEIEPLYMLPAV